jgi:hypothetical protein
MRRPLVTGIALIGLVANTMLVSAAPPARPLAITADQFAALQQMQQQPEHQQVLDTRATYQSEHEKVIEFNRKANDISTAATYAGYPALILALLICAAPL